MSSKPATIIPFRLEPDNSPSDNAGESQNPAQTDLRLSDRIYQQWRQALRGEIEGLDLTLSFLDSKRTEAMSWIRRDHVSRGTPTAQRSAS